MMLQFIKQLLAPLLRLRAVLDGDGIRQGGTDKLMKKTSEIDLAVGNQEMAAVSNSVEPNHSIDSCTVPVDHPKQQEKVNLIIHEGLTDMWLLATGEEIDSDSGPRSKHNGRPLAIVCDGQMRLMESRPVTIDALRTVGIEMS
jgi:hypothetical protein